jgi:hypothetical protein
LYPVPFASLTGLVRDAVKVSLALFKVMVPIILVVKLLKELGGIEYLAAPLGPVMELVGLPAGLGLAWATAMLSNIYSGLIVFQALAGETGPLTEAQVTVLGVLMLIAHNLLVEGQVTKRCGVSFFGQNLLRIGGAFACAWLLHVLFASTGILSGPAVMLWLPPPAESSLLGWAWGETKNLCYIFLIILALMGLMRLLNFLGLTRLLEKLLTPFLKLMGIGSTAATVTVIGMTMGLTYGGGLIIHETQAGHISKKDVFAAVSLMSLSHALIEDTLLLALIGTSPWGSLVGRLLFSLVVTAMLSRWAASREHAGLAAKA